jgi:hypothetical protein
VRSSKPLRGGADGKSAVVGASNDCRDARVSVPFQREDGERVGLFGLPKHARRQANSHGLGRSTCDFALTDQRAVLRE